MPRSEQRLVALRFCVATLAWVAVVVLLDQGGRARGGTRLHRPPAGAVVRASPDRAIEVSGTARGRDALKAALVGKDCF